METATILKDAFRPSDILGRVGGDEFAVSVTGAWEDSIPILTERPDEQMLHRADALMYERKRRRRALASR